MKKLLGLIVISVVMSGIVCADTYYPVYIKEQSGYNTDSRVVDYKDVFTRYQFVGSDFNLWLAQLYHAQAVEQFEAWVSAGIISSKGVVLRPGLVLGDVSYGYGAGITFGDIVAHTSHPYGSDQLVRDLNAVGVLASDGYVVGLQVNQKLTQDQADFSTMMPKLKRMKLPVSNPKAHAALQSELNELIISRHRQKEITTVKTTTYQSRNDNLFNAFIESMGGNFLAKVFMPDQSDVSRARVAYVPQTDFYRLYNLRVGFAPYAGYAGRPGLWCIDGDMANGTLDFSTMGTTTTKYMDVTYEYDWMMGRQSYAQEFGFLQFRGRYAQVTEPSGRVSSYYVAAIPFISGGGVGRQTSMDLNLGLAYATAYDRNALGFHVGGDFSWTFLNPVGFDLSGQYYVQPSFSSGGGSLWAQSVVSAGLTVVPYPSTSVFVGYRWLKSHADVDAGGMAFGFKYYLP
jgi:hypothetical protein